MHVWLPEVSPFEKIIRSLVVYVFLVVMFRVLGKREVGQMTPFDLIVLLILSNVLQNAMIGPDNSILGGLIGATTILTANWMVSRAAFSSRLFHRAVEGVPTLLVHQGMPIEANLRHESITHEDLLASLRSQGIFSLSEVNAAVLETSGKVSVLRREPSTEAGKSR
jgi:uncharacterized membrane protein YcaP (DUF421 family)